MTKIGKFWRPFIASKFSIASPPPRPPIKKRMMFVPPLSMVSKQSSPMSLITIIMRVIKSAIPVGLWRINLLYVDYYGYPNVATYKLTQFTNIENRYQNKQLIFKKNDPTSDYGQDYVIVLLL